MENNKTVIPPEIRKTDNDSLYGAYLNVSWTLYKDESKWSPAEQKAGRDYLTKRRELLQLELQRRGLWEA